MATKFITIELSDDETTEICNALNGEAGKFFELARENSVSKQSKDIRNAHGDKLLALSRRILSASK